jgi:hypothetical protein
MEQAAIAHLLGDVGVPPHLTFLLFNSGFPFAKILAAITTPSCTATNLSPVIANSLLKIILIQLGNTCNSTIAINALATNNFLSANGCKNLPKPVIKLYFQA